MSEKNLDIIIEACRLINWDKNSDLRFIIIGDGNNKKDLKQRQKNFILKTR